MMNFEEYEKYVQEQLQKVDDIILDEMIDQATECVAEIKARTPVKTGALRRSMTWGEINHSADSYSVNVGSSLQYAKYVEEGYEQKVGKYIPALGKRLKTPFVQGYHMINDSITIHQDILEKRIAVRIENEVFK